VDRVLAPEGRETTTWTAVASAAVLATARAPRERSYQSFQEKAGHRKTVFTPERTQNNSGRT
jgi:hypothetical protein